MSDPGNAVVSEDQPEVIARGNSPVPVDISAQAVATEQIDKAGIRNEEHRQGIIRNELNTDFAEEPAREHDDGMDMG